MNEPKWILEELVTAIHGILLSEHGGSEGIRDIALLEFAYDRNATTFELAAAYSFGIAKNHPFVDGNKRTAFMAGVLFLEINGFKFIASESESTSIFEGLADSKISEPELSRWFEKNCQQD